jgi:hypothetical protein
MILAEDFKCKNKFLYNYISTARYWGIGILEDFTLRGEFGQLMLVLHYKNTRCTIYINDYSTTEVLKLAFRDPYHLIKLIILKYKNKNSQTNNLWFDEFKANIIFNDKNKTIQWK